MKLAATGGAPVPSMKVAPRVTRALSVLSALLPLPLFAILAAAAAGEPQAATPASGAYACYVEAVEGSGISVVRVGGVTVPVVPLLPLYSGDRLMFSALRRDSWVRAACGSSPVTFTRSTVIERRGQAPHVLDNVLAWITDFFAESESKVETVRALTKGPGHSLGAPRVLAFSGRAEVVVAGRRKLCLAWEGGKPPFSIKVFAGRSSEREVVGVHDGEFGWAATIDLARPVVAAPVGGASTKGSYEVQIEDAMGRSTFTGFVGIEAATVPRWPDDLAGDNDDAVLRTVRAAWLSSYGDGLYTFEALQRACDLAPQVQAAETLRRALAMGLRPPPY
jgi:hypothetical protein